MFATPALAQIFSIHFIPIIHLNILIYVSWNVTFSPTLEFVHVSLDGCDDRWTILGPVLLTQDDSAFEALPMLAEVIKLKDTSVYGIV